MKRATPEYNLLACNPTLAAEWDYARNGDLRPEHVTPKSARKVWWIGKCGCSWRATVVSRTNGCGCARHSAITANRRRVNEDNCLAASYPDVAAMWHPTRNGTLTPHDVMAQSSKRVWWRCEYGHEWAATVNNRVVSTGLCPYCSGKYKIGVSMLHKKDIA